MGVYRNYDCEYQVAFLNVWRPYYRVNLQVFGLYLSTYIVVIISIDRCIAILDPISKNRGPHRVKIMIGIAWILSAVFSLPQVRAVM